MEAKTAACFAPSSLQEACNSFFDFGWVHSRAHYPGDLMGSLPGSLPSDLTVPLLADVGADDAGKQTTKVSHLAALRAGAMLGQMCERSLIEHQLAACYFAFHNFCEHAPGYSSCG